MTIVSHRAKDADGNDVKDLTADIRSKVIGAIARNVANHDTDFCRNGRFGSLLVDSNRVCPIGPEAMPVFPHALGLLQDWTKLRISRGWPPREKLERFMISLGRSSEQARGKSIPAIKEMISNEATTKEGLAELRKMLQELED